MITLLTDAIDYALLPLSYLIDSKQRVFLLYLIIAYIPVAIFSYAAQRKGWSFKKILHSCFPHDVWRHNSSYMDRWLFFINTIVMKGLLLPYITISHFTSQATNSLFSTIFGEVNTLTDASTATILAITALFFLATDFAVFFIHYLQHKVSFLWEFHKIHHSAEVLTPLTVYRMHPVDDLLYILFGSLMAGTVIGAVDYLYLNSPNTIDILGLNLFAFLFYVSFYNLRHSHFWLHYGKLGHIFISPAMHQCHHSEAEKHWDKNLGFMLSIWDKLFGTLYVPVEKEDLTLGIREETSEYNSLTKLYLLPFKKNWQKLIEKTRVKRQ